MNYWSLITCITLLLTGEMSGQVVRCGTNPAVIDDRPSTLLSYPRSVLEVPIVFHIVWNQDAENLSEATILSQLAVINEDFSAANPDLSNVPRVFEKHIGNPSINFCLATTSPSGTPSSGIVNVRTVLKDIADENNVINNQRIIMNGRLGGSDAWDPTRYLNVWIGARGDGILGDASFPITEGDTFNDGIVIDYRAVGRQSGGNGKFDLGRTLTHEIGHYLNLYHLPGSEAGCFNDDDLVEDTPVQFDEYFGACEGSVSSCDSRDMDMNFMNFRDDECLIFFTKGQVERMREAIFRYRYDLVNGNICSSNNPIPDDPLKIATVFSRADRLEVSLSTLVNRDYFLSMYDVSGRLIWIQEDNPTHLYTLEHSAFASGIYILYLQLGDKRWARKVYID